jgi:hypothetical protein
MQIRTKEMIAEGNEKVIRRLEFKEGEILTPDSSVNNTFTPSTYTDRYNELVRKNLFRLSSQLWFNRTSDNLPVYYDNDDDTDPKLLFSKGLAHGSSEAKVQEYWNSGLLLLNKDSKIVLVDEHLRATIGNRKPDLVGYQPTEGNVVRHSFYHTLPADLKPRREENAVEEFSHDEIGREHSFLSDLMNIQSWREHVTGS